MSPTQSIRAAAIVGAMVVPTAAWAAQEPASPQMAGVAQAAVNACAQAHPLAERTIELANKRLEMARQSNSAAAMRTAVDDLQAALRQLRTEIAPCAGVQASAPAGPAGHVMPGTTQAPAAPPGTPIVYPGASAPAPAAVGRPAPAAADPHAGHVMPGAPQSPASAPVSVPPPRPPAAAPRSPTAPAPAADPHGGHVMPPATARPAVPAGRAAAPARSATPAAPVSRTPPGSPPTASAAAAARTAATPATSIAELTCQNQVDARTAPRVLHQGQMYYFCSEQDRAAFVKNPGKYGVEASSTQSAPAHAH